MAGAEYIPMDETKTTPRDDLEGLELKAEDGTVCYVHGLPTENKSGLEFYASYRDSGLCCLAWPAGLTAEEFAKRLGEWMAEQDAMLPEPPPGDGAVKAEPVDPELQAVIDAWDGLPVEKRDAILASVAVDAAAVGLAEPAEKAVP